MQTYIQIETPTEVYPPSPEPEMDRFGIERRIQLVQYDQSIDWYRHTVIGRYTPARLFTVSLLTRYYH